MTAQGSAPESRPGTRRAVAARLGPVGVWLGALSSQPAAAERRVVEELEQAGYGAIWFGEAPASREALAHAALLLGWTSRVTVATGIASIYARDATAAARGAATLGEAHPGRFLLGLGVSHAPLVERRGARYDRPVSAMRAYLDAYAQAGAERARFPEPDPPVPVVLAALRPRMLELARDAADGAHPYFVPVEHTAAAREALGADRLLLPELAVLLERDPSRARDQARRHTAYYLGLPNYRNGLLATGFEEADLEDGGSDRLVDALVAWGSVDDVVGRVRAHLDAGADHVAIQSIADDQPRDLLELAPALAGLAARP